MQRPGWDPADPSPSSDASADPAGAPAGPAGPAGPAWASPPGGAPAPAPAGSGSYPTGPDAPGPYAAGPQPPGPFGAGSQPPGPYAGGPQPPGQYGAGQPAPPYPGAPEGAGPYWPGPGPYAPGPGEWGGGPWPGAAPVRRAWPPTRRELTAALLTIAGLALLGAALAVLWTQLAPRLEFRVVQPGRAVPVIPEAEEYVAADGRFVLLTLAAGVAAGLVCWLLRRTRGPVVLAALALGGLLGAVVTWRVGIWLAPGYSPADLQEVGRTVMEPLALRARAALVVEPVAAVIVYLLAAGFTVHNDLGVERDVEKDPVS